MKKSILLVGLLVMVLTFGGFATAQESVSGELEIFSWWAGDEGPALEALIELYNAMYPDVEVINATVTGGSGVNARAVLKTRMLGGNPPDSFQVHAGEELTGTWVVADRMVDLTDLFEAEGLFDVFPQDLLDLIVVDGGVYSVPVNIHRSNVMWYNPDKFAEWGLEVPATWDAFLNDVCPVMQSAGVTPLVVGEAWTVNHLWESVALAVLGAEGWNGIWSGDTDPAGAEMVAVWDAFGDVLACSNIAEASGLSWQQAIDEVVAGTAGINIMGDWAAGYMTTTLGLEPGTGFGYAAAPDTDAIFMWLSDSFGLPVGASNVDAAMAWLAVLGSVEGQNAFNQLKGSIPARNDAVAADPDGYNAYLLSAADDWDNDVLVGSLVHGTAANERFMGEFNTVMEVYLATNSSTAAASAMQAVCIQSGACGN